MNLDELMTEMKSCPTSLFYGAGVSVACGGPSWDELFSAIKAKFSGSTANDFFTFMQETIGYDNANRAEMEGFIRRRLGSVSPNIEQEYLFSIPWRAVLTTNYDHLPEAISVTIDGSRQIMPIGDPSEETDRTREDHLYCFKLLGDCRYSFPQGGWMVLSTSDLFSAAERRTMFFKLFRNLATSGHIVYLGYSFKDDLVFLLLSQMKTVLGRFPWKGFAIIPDEPEPQITKKMESVGITWIKGSLQDFVVAARKTFGDKPQSAPVEVGFVTIHGQTIDLDRSTFSNIKNKFSILHDDLMISHSEKPADFLQGFCRTFYPYVLNWDFPRKTEIFWSNPKTRVSLPKNLRMLKDRVTMTELSENLFCALIGIAGSGKSIFANRIAFEWRQTGNPVIFVNPDVPLLDKEALDGLMNEIRDKYLKKADAASIKNPHPLRWLVIADGCGAILSQLRVLKNHLLSAAKPGDILLVTRESETPMEKLKNFELDAVYKMDDTVLEDEHEKFLGHFDRFGIIDEDIAKKNLQDKDVNSSFFALIYSTMHHSRKNIKRLLKEEYDKLDEGSKKTYQITSLIQAYQLDPLLPIIVKSQDIDPDWLSSQVKSGSLSGVVRPGDYGHSLFAFQRVVAEAISEAVFRTSDERKLALNNIISAITFGEISEMRFLENLLNWRIELDIGPRLMQEHKIDLYHRAIGVVKSKPLMIHLGRLETNARKFSDASKTLKEAYNAYVKGFDERIEHVKDAEGRLEYAIAEDEIFHKRIDSAWDHLKEAEQKFLEAKIDPGTTPHPFEGLGRTYLAEARLVKEESLQWDLTLAAMQECNYVEKYLGESSEISLLKMEVENSLRKLGFDETHIEKIQNRVGKANGYAYLVEIKIAQGNLKDALKLVEKGLLCDGMCIWLMRLRVSLLRKLSPDDHESIIETLDDYAAVSREKYDVELSFELAKETYMAGNIVEAKTLFRDLSKKAANHPRKLIPREPEDRWIEEGKPKSLNGTLTKLPTENLYGSVQTTFPRNFAGSLVVRKPDLRYAIPPPSVGDRVSYEIVFNMLGPEASKVRRL